MNKKVVVTGVLALSIVGCTETSQMSGFHESVPFSTCDDAESLFSFLNGTSEDELKSIGVHTKGARELIAHRNGPDGVAFTADDDLFDSWKEVDDVPQVGPVTMEVLTAHSSSLCVWSEVIFSPQPSWSESHLARFEELIDDAHTSIDIAMYSFRDYGLLDAVEDAVDRGVSVRAILEYANDDRKDPEGTLSATLEDMGVEVRGVNKIMHHKFLIIDGPRTSDVDIDSAVVGTGSGNWSWSAATRYDENTVFFAGDDRAVLSFQAEYDLMWENGREVVWNEDIAPVETTPITPEMIEDAGGSEVLFTSGNFKTSVSSTHGNTFSRNTDDSQVALRLTELIWSAEESLEIASGHLRSRVIAEAIVAKAEADPDVQIRVYLDGQEFTRESSYQEEVDEFESCLVEASTATQERNCYERGVHFGYLLAEAGIDLRFKAYSYRWDVSYAEQMHHKYIIIDGTTVASGSYNFSSNAEFDTFENVIVYDSFRYPELVGEFTENFNEIWTTGEGLYEPFMKDLEVGTSTNIPLIFEPMAISWLDFAILKEEIERVCPDVFSDEFRDDPRGHGSCER